MHILRLSLSVATASLIAIGLTACTPGTDASGEHDHSTHESGAPVSDGAAAHDHAAMADDDHAAGGHDMEGMEGMDAMPAGLVKIEPSADYPLTTCVVSGEALGGEMGPPMAYEYNGEEVQFCCEGCLDEFKASPEEFMAKVRAKASTR